MTNLRSKGSDLTIGQWIAVALAASIIVPVCVAAIMLLLIPFLLLAGLIFMWAFNLGIAPLLGAFGASVAAISFKTAFWSSLGLSILGSKLFKSRSVNTDSK